MHLKELEYAQRLMVVVSRKENARKVTFPWSSDGDIHVTQMALAALDNPGRRGRRGAGGSALLVVPQAALLLDGRSIPRQQRGEAVLAAAAVAAVGLARGPLAHAGLLAEDRSARRQLRL